MPFDANGNWVTNNSNSPLYGGGLSNPQQGGFSQPYSQGYYGGYDINPSGTSSTTESTTTPKDGGSGINPVGAALGVIQIAGGLYGMNKLNKQKYPEYAPTQATLAAAGRAQQLAKMGYTPAQIAAFKANIGTTLNTQFANSSNMADGNLSGALTARGTGQRLSALNQFAAADADRQMGNIRYADQQTAGLQHLQNMQTESALRRRIMLEQAYGGAIRKGSENLTNAFDMGRAMSSFAKYAAIA